MKKQKSVLSLFLRHDVRPNLLECWLNTRMFATILTLKNYSKMVKILKKEKSEVPKKFATSVNAKKAKIFLVFQPYNIFGEGYMMIFVKETNSVERRKSN